MKTLLIASLCFFRLALTSFSQTPPSAPATSPANPATMATPAAPATSPAAGMTPATAVMTPATTIANASPAATANTAPGTSSTTETGNFLIDNFNKGGPIMWPILVVSITALAVVLERIFWWLGRWLRRDPKRIEKVFTAIEVGDVAEASRLSRDSRDPVLRML